MPLRLRWFTHRLLLLLTVVTATRGATWSHDCVMPSPGHDTTGAVSAGESAGHAGHTPSSHASGHEHTADGASQALAATSAESPAEHDSSGAPHGDCTCIGDCCTTVAASVGARCSAVPAPVVVAHVTHALRADRERLPLPPAHLHPFANGPPAASLA